MKPTDLRLNNIITDENGFEMYVVGIYEDYIAADFKGNEGDVWEFDFKHSFPKPVDLTEEILLKCGFEKTKNGEYPHKYVINKGMGYEVEIENLNAYNCFVLSHGRKFSVVRIDYLHQLQNIFWILTGTELKINL